MRVSSFEEFLTASLRKDYMSDLRVFSQHIFYDGKIIQLAVSFGERSRR
jgi:hypothetical protein